jgi:hypothetical protein
LGIYLFYRYEDVLKNHIVSAAKICGLKVDVLDTPLAGSQSTLARLG